MTLRVALTLAAVGMLLAMACSDREPRSPIQPSPSAESATENPGSLTLPVPSDGRPRAAVTFPPQNEPFDFRQRLETHYRDVRRAPLGQSFVDLLGGGVWISEYIRYRVNLCSHTVAVANVFTRVDTEGRVDPPVCGNAPSGVIEFPPRNEPAAFRQQLEVKYRDQLRRNPTPTFVDLEGDIVWMQQYFLYRLNECDHLQSVNRTLTNIESGQVQSFCHAPTSTTTTSIRTTTSTIASTTTTSIAVPPPVARITGPTGAVNTNSDIDFSGLTSTAGAGLITRFDWTCGDTTVTDCNSTAATPKWRYPKTGMLKTMRTVTVTLVVTNSAGIRSATATFQLTLTNSYG